MQATELLAKLIRHRGISLKAIALGTGLPVGVVYPSLGKKPRRPLRVDEFFRICKFIQEDPLQFAPREETLTDEQTQTA